MDGAVNNELSLKEIEDGSCFKINPCISQPNWSELTKLKLETSEKEKIKMHINSLQQYLPSAAAAGTMATAYRVEFPKGLPHTLTALKQGGFGTMIRNDGKIVGSASLYSLSPQAAFMGIFTVMSIFTGQFFLSSINKELGKLNQKLDDILAFLYGDKKAGLIAEFNFVTHTYNNCCSIMLHDQQRGATIASLQGAEKVAMQDMEFYIANLQDRISKFEKDQAKSFGKLTDVTHGLLRDKECMELSIQLYIMSCIMESYFSQNQDTRYLESIQEDMMGYIEKCNERLLLDFGGWAKHIKNYSTKAVHQKAKDELEKRFLREINSLQDNGIKSLKKAVDDSTKAISEPSEYYIDSEANVYVSR